jgi:hypothetical protein
LRVIGDRWGVTATEIQRRYPCDDLVPNPAMEAWRGVTVMAQPNRVWPWLAQIRLAPYSYDWIDNSDADRRSGCAGFQIRCPGSPSPTLSEDARPGGFSP